MTTEERNQLVTDHLRLAYHIAGRFAWALRAIKVDRSDLEGIACVALVEAARYYDPKVGSFACYAGVCIRRRFSREIRKVAYTITPGRNSVPIHPTGDLNLDMFVGREPDPAEMPEPGPSRADLVGLAARLTPKQREYITRKYGLDGREPETSAQIAARCGVYHQTVVNQIAVGLRRLRSFVQEKGEAA